MKTGSFLISGVSRGLGLVIASRLLDEGHRVFGLSRTSSSEVADLSDRYPERFAMAQVDLADNASLERNVFKDFLPKGTALNGLVNNAAVAYDDLVSNLDLERLDEMFRINVYAAMILSRGCIRNFLLHNTPGSLVHISSICAHTGFKGLSFYGATKGALEAFSKNLAREWGARSIRSNAIAAGFMETSMTDSLDEQVKERVFRRPSLGGPTSVEKVAQTVEFLLSNSSGAVTGEVIRADNGSI